MLKVEVKKLKWGDILSPSQKALSLGLRLKKDDRGMFLGVRRTDGTLAIVKVGESTVSSWHYTLWDLQEEPTK